MRRLPQYPVPQPLLRVGMGGSPGRKVRDGRYWAGGGGRGKGFVAASLSVRGGSSNAKRSRFLSQAVASCNFIFPPPQKDLSMRCLLILSPFVMLLPALRAADDYKL